MIADPEKTQAHRSMWSVTSFFASFLLPGSSPSRPSPSCSYNFPSPFTPPSSPSSFSTFCCFACFSVSVPSVASLLVFRAPFLYFCSQYFPFFSFPSFSLLFLFLLFISHRCPLTFPSHNLLLLFPPFHHPSACVPRLCITYFTFLIHEMS